MKIDIATDKVPKYARRDSGDSFEIAERPKGGITAILADGQGSGKSAKLTSNMVATKASSLIADGTRDGAVARAAHDFLYAQKDGRVSSTLNLLSCDLATNSLLISRNSNCPTIVKTDDKVEVFEESNKPIGFHHFVKPTIDELAIEPNTVVLTFTDGIYHAGKRFNKQLNLEELISLVQDFNYDKIEDLSSKILQLAIERDKKRPQDDMSVLALGISAGEYDLKPRQVRVGYTF